MVRLLEWIVVIAAWIQGGFMILVGIGAFYPARSLLIRPGVAMRAGMIVVGLVGCFVVYGGVALHRHLEHHQAVAVQTPAGSSSLSGTSSSEPCLVTGTGSQLCGPAATSWCLVPPSRRSRLNTMLLTPRARLPSFRQ